MNIAVIYRKMLLLIAVLLLVCNSLKADPVVPDSYDTLSFCQSELPFMYDTLTITEAGDYMVTLDSSLGNDSVVQLHVIVHNNPTPVIEGDMGHCVNSNATVYVSDSYASYLWSTGSVVYYTFTSDSSCSVEVTDEWGCKGTAHLDFEIYQLPEISVLGDLSMCYQSSNVINASGAVSYYWFNNDGVRISNEDSLLYVADKENGYIDTITIRAYSSNNCVSQKIIELEVYPKFESFDTAILCRSELPYLYHGQEYWQDSTYEVHLTSEKACDSLILLTLIVYENPDVQIVGVDSLCAGQTDTLKASGAASYIWSTASTEEEIVAQAVQWYWLQGTDTNACSARDSLYLTAVALPDVGISGDEEICYGETFTLTATGADKYVWSTGDSTASISLQAIEGASYQVTAYNAFLCTATATAYVEVNEVYSTPLNVSICRNKLPYLYNGQAYTQAGTYQVHLTSEKACDSLVLLTLVVYENPEVRIVGVDSLCVGQTGILRAEGADSYIWNTASTSEEIVSQAGQWYWLQGMDSHACTTIDSLYVTAVPLPVVSISGEEEICFGNSFTLTAAGGRSYEWSTGETTASISLQPTEGASYQVTAYNDFLCSATASAYVEVNEVYDTTIRVSLCQSELPYVYNGQEYTQTGVYDVHLTSVEGCDSLIHLNLTVLENPYAQINGNTEICPGASTQLSANGNGTYLWSTGATRSPITVTSPAWYKLTVTAPNGCQAFDSVEVSYLPLPEVSISGDSTTCSGTSVTLTASGASSYVWNSGVVGPTMTVTPTVNTVYMVTGTSNRGCTATASHALTVNALPHASIVGETSVCQGDTAIFIAAGGLTYRWSTGETTATVKLTAAGNYTVTITDANGCSATAEKTLSLKSNPSVSITGQHYICENGNTTLYATGSGIVSYVWNGTIVSQSLTVTSAGTYTVEVTSSNSCTASASLTLVEKANPQVYISGELSFCDGQHTLLTASGGTSYIWRNAYGTQLSTSADILVSEGGSYSVTATDANACSSSQQVSVVKKNLPTVSIIATKDEFCQGEQANLIAGYSSGYTYLWNTGATERQITVNTGGTYVLQVTLNGCVAIDSTTIKVNPLPSVSISGPSETCSGNSEFLTAVAPTAVSYSWNTGSTSNQISVNEAGTYTLTVTSDQGCQNSSSKQFVVRELPIVNISAPAVVCSGSEAVLTASGTGTGYQWSSGETGSVLTVYPTVARNYQVTATNDYACTATTTAHIGIHEVYETTLNASCCQSELPYQYNGQEYMQAGTYDVHLSSVYGCDSLVHLNLTVLENPYAFISGNTDICPGASTQLSANGSGTFLWSTGATRSPITVNTPGWYVLTVTAQNGCKAYDSVQVALLPLPTVTISGDSYVCRGSEIIMSASGANSYVWNTGVIGSTLTVSPTQTTTYMVTGTSTAGCSSTASHTVSVNALPTAFITGDNEICQGDTAIFTATGGLSYLWSTGETTASVQLTDAQIYTVTVTDANACTATASRNLTVYSNPTVSIIGQNSFCENGSTLLSAMGTGTSSYVWDNLYLGQSFTVTQAGLHTVMALSPNGCSSTASVMVTQLPNPILTVSGELSFCDGQSTQITAGGAQTYSWRNAFGTQIATGAEVSLNEGGSYSVVATDNNGCTATQQFVLTKKNLPNATIIASTNEVCEGTDVTLSAGYVAGYAYLWSNGSTERQTTINTAGTYVLQVTANACTAVDSTTITMHPLPLISFTGDTVICKGNIADIYASAPDASSFLWNTGSQENHLSVAPMENTDYWVIVEDIYGCVNQDTVRVEVEDTPQPHILAPDSICRGGEAQLTVSGGVSYIWDDESTDSVRIVSEAGTYTVTAYTVAGCSATTQKTIYYYDDPLVSIEGDSTMCLGDSVVLTAHGALNYMWFDGSIDTCVTVSSSGVYTLEGWDAKGCSARDSIEVRVWSLPSVQIVGNHTACSGTVNMLTAQAPTAVSYLWSNGETTAQIQANQTAVYSVVVSDSNACHAEALFSFTLRPAPSCSILGRTDICLGDTTILTASNGETFFWSTGAVTQSISVSPSNPQNYTLIIVDENACTASATVRVTPHASEPIIITGDNAFCEGDSVLLVATASGELIWSNGHQGDSLWVSETGDYEVWAVDSTSCLLPSSMHVEKHLKPIVEIMGDAYLCAGDTGTLYAQTDASVSYQWTTGDTLSTIHVNSTNVYGVTVVDTFGCSNSTSRLLVVYSAPTVGIEGPTTACNGSTVTLNATGTANHFLWSTGDTSAVITQNPRYTTDYVVVGSNDYGCSASASLHLTVVPIPTVSITGDTNLCEGEVTTLTSSNASSFHWSTGSSNRSINVSQSGTYTVVVSNAYGCTNSASVYVQVYEYPNLVILGDTMLCRGEQTELLAIGANNYLWNTGSTNPRIVVSPENSTYYTVQAMNGECMSAKTVQVVVNDVPTASITAADGICEGSSTILTANGGIAYLWSTGQTATMIDVNTAGTYQVIAFNQHGCTDTTSHVLVQYPEPQVSISGPTAICQNEQATLSAEGSGSYLWNTGDTASAITINTADYYYVQLTDANGCSAMAGQNVTQLSSPVIVIAGTNDMCENDTVSLTVACANTASFIWNTGETSNTIEVSPNTSTTYTVTAVSADNCTAQQSHTLAVHQSYAAEFTAEICQGNSYSGQGFSIPVQNEPGVFDFTSHLQTAFGCDSVRVLHLTVKAIPAITGGISGNTEVSTLGNYVYMITPVEGATSYEWILSNPNWNVSFNQTVAQVGVLTPGSATLYVYALNECGQSQPVSIQINYSGIGIDEVEISTVQVFPNPTSGMVKLQCSQSNGQLFEGEIHLFDMYGKFLNRWEMSGNDMELVLSSYAAGVYLLKLKNSQTASESTVKLVKQNN